MEQAGINPKVCAIICTILGNRELSARSSRIDEIIECLQSVRANTYEPFEIIVVDQSADDSLAAAIEPLVQQEARLRYVHLDRPGKGRAMNTAVRGSDAAIFAFTDDDCIVPAHWVTDIVESFRRHPDAGIFFGDVCLPEGHDWATAYVPYLHWDADVQLRPAFLPRVNNLMGANMAVRRETFERIGLFEERFDPHSIIEEVELAFRAWRSQPPVPVYLTPAFAVVHAYGGRPVGQPTRRLLRTYYAGSTVLVATHAARGDAGAICKLVMMAYEPFVDAGRGILRTGKPRGLGKVIPYMQGTFRGVRGAWHLDAGNPPRLEN